jgi:hypothetical protein
MMSSSMESSSFISLSVEVQSKVVESEKPRNCRYFQGCAGAQPHVDNWVYGAVRGAGGVGDRPET